MKTLENVSKELILFAYIGTIGNKPIIEFIFQIDLKDNEFIIGKN